MSLTGVKYSELSQLPKGHEWVWAVCMNGGKDVIETNKELKPLMDKYGRGDEVIEYLRITQEKEERDTDK